MRAATRHSDDIARAGFETLANDFEQIASSLNMKYLDLMDIGLFTSWSSYRRNTPAPYIGCPTKIYSPRVSKEIYGGTHDQREAKTA